MIPGSANPLLLRSAAPTAYQVSRSLRFNSSDSGFLSRTPASAGNRKKWTWSGWVKRTKLSVFTPIFTSGVQGTADPRSSIAFNDSNQLSTGVNVSNTWYNIITSAVYRDASAWYHIVVACDTAQATAANRMRLYVNGSEVTQFSSASYVGPDTDTSVNNTVAHGIGRYINNPSDGDANMYLADIWFLDGLTPTTAVVNGVTRLTQLGEFDTNGIWQPKAWDGAALTGNSFHLDFADNSAATAAALGKDTSGNGNNWTPNNLSVTAGAGNDSTVDSPTNYGTDTGAGGEVRGNYATLNPLVYGSGATFSNGNLEATFSASDVVATHLLDAGKYYWEVTCGTITTSPSVDAYYGLIQPYSYSGARNWGAGNVRTWRNGGSLYGNGSTGTVTSYTTGDVLGFAYDGSAGNLYVAKNGTWQNSANPASGTGAVFTGIAANTFVPGFSVNASSSITFNAGARPFAYTAPSGFKALCTANLPTPTIAKGSDYFDVKLYTGNGSTQTISGLNFSPDFIWLKDRGQARSHRLIDTVRGIQYQLFSDTTSGGSTYDATSYVSSVTATSSTGFTVDGTGSDAYNELNKSYVAWTWDAGSSTVSNTAGSITSTVRANASAGFSVVTWTGNGGTNATVGHGLGVAPQFIFAKWRGGASDWEGYHIGAGATKVHHLNTADIQTLGHFGSTNPTSTVFTVNASGTGNEINGNNQAYVAYCFAPVAGYSSFGSYTGNGSADGPFVFCNFRPRWILIKNTSTTADWCLFDTARDTYNQALGLLNPNLSNAENILGSGLDILSNGFKLRRDASPAINNNANTFVYAAFAESPFAYARAR